MKTTTTGLRVIPMSRTDKTYFGNEPSWLTQPMSASTYNTNILWGLHWHRTVTDATQWRSFFAEWIRSQNHADQVEHLSRLEQMPDAALYSTACILARMTMQGFILNDTHQRLVTQFYDTVQTYQKPAPVQKEATADAVRPAADRVRDFVRPLLSDIDFLADELFDKREQYAHTVLLAIKERPYKTPHYTVIAEHLRRYMNEWQAAIDCVFPDLTEAYSCHAPRTIRRAVAVFEQLMMVVDEKLAVTKIKRVVKKRPVDKNKVVAKVRYCTADASLNVKSINPADIIGSTVLWVYDTEKRKLGMFEAEEKGGLYIKGTTVYGFKASCVKTIRKPAIQIPELVRLRKPQWMPWLNSIRAKCGEMNGRLNAQMLLLRAD